MELLNDYAQNASEAAFTELVRRHVSLVYSAALRHIGIAGHAEEITQAVFIIFARKAANLRQGIVLEGWLYETTRLTALSFLRNERRRQFREQEAYMQSTLKDSDENTSWAELSPLLDKAVSSLGRKDRDAVILRFFKEKSVREVASAMHMNEAAAQRRTLRALEKLRKFFAKRGVASTAAVIAGAISANSIQAAPATLAQSVTTATLVKGATVSATTLTLIKGALKVMAWTKTQTAIVSTAIILLAAGTTGIIVYHRVQSTSQPKPTVSTQNDFPKSSWHFAGFADPESALESTLWAMSQGDVKSYLASLAPDGGLFREAQGRPENQIVSQNKQVVDGIAGYKIINEQKVSDDEVIITFQPEVPDGTKPVHPGRMVIRLVDGEWKVSG